MPRAGSRSSAFINMSDQHHINGLLNGILDQLIAEMIAADCNEMHWLVNSGIMTIDELYNVRPIGQSLQDYEDITGITGRRLMEAEKKKNTFTRKDLAEYHKKKLTICPVCSEVLSAYRFAAHLDRCFLGKGRNTRPSSSNNSNGTNKNTSNGYGNNNNVFADPPVIRREKIEWVDPYPRSRIIRMRLYKGNLKAVQNREGVSDVEWDKAVAERDGTAPAEDN